MRPFHGSGPLLFALALAAGPAVGGCKGGGAAPEKPFTGAPVAFEATSVDVAKETVEARAYNFSDKTLASYQLIFRYHDASGKVLPVNEGTPLAKDFANWSVSGLPYKAAPKTWAKMKFDRLKIPAGATSAEILMTSGRALASNGISFETQDAWSMPYVTKWPEKK